MNKTVDFYCIELLNSMQTQFLNHWFQSSTYADAMMALEPHFLTFWNMLDYHMHWQHAIYDLKSARWVHSLFLRISLSLGFSLPTFVANIFVKTAIRYLLQPQLNPHRFSKIYKSHHAIRSGHYLGHLWFHRIATFYGLLGKRVLSA